MDTTVCFAAGPKERCDTKSPKVAVQWDSNIIYCGFRAAYRVTLTGVTGIVLVKIRCRTIEGKLLDESELHLSSETYMNKMLIPFNVLAGTPVYIEILLPEYGVVYKSACKPVYNSIPVKSMHVKPENRSKLAWITRPVLGIALKPKFRSWMQRIRITY